MKRVLLAGYYGFGNAGDELLLSAVLPQLRRTAEVAVLSADPASTRTTHGVAALKRWSVFAVLTALLRSDRIVFGGGGLFQDATSFFGFAYYATLASLAICLRKEVQLLAQGLGPLQGLWSRIWMRFILGRASCSFRDEESAQLARTLLSGGDFALTADPVFLLPLPPRPTTASPAGPILLFVPRGSRPLELRLSRFGIRPEQLEAALIRAFSGWREQTGGRIQILLFHPDHDRKIGERYARALSAELLEPSDFRRIPSLVVAADFVVAMRYHALVLAAGAGRASLGIGGDPKIAALVRDLSGEADPEGLAAFDSDPGAGWSERLSLRAMSVWNRSSRNGTVQYPRLARILERLRSQGGTQEIPTVPDSAFQGTL